MSEELFPTGPWTGFYSYAPQDKHRMDLHLTFANGHMTGAGNDDVGAFVVKGRYDSTSLECHFTKGYLGAHEVYYHGYREGKGIWGRWEINALDHGGFHIWPAGEEATAKEEKTEEQQPLKEEQPQPSAA